MLRLRPVIFKDGNTMYDIIVIGGGPAGLTAALYARRQNKSVLVLEKNSFGGQTVYSPKIENYPGFKEMSGVEFSDKLVDQVLDQGAELEMEQVIKVVDNGATKTVVTEDNTFEAKSVIIATGAKHRMLGLVGEEDYVGNGISFCAVCDGAFYNGKEVAVIGGGNSALQEALLLSQNCKKVNVIQNLAFLTGEQKLIDSISAKDNVSVTLNTVVTAISGVDGALTGLVLKSTETGEETTINVDGVFVAIGLVPDNDCVKDIIALDDRGYVPADESTVTTVNGIFVAGDCRSKTIRQIATAISDGATAALSACKYCENI